MEKRAAATALALAALLPVSAAKADLTVSFATDGPAPAMSATMITTAATPEPTPTPEPAPESVPAPVAVAPAIEARFVRVGDGSGESATLVLRDGETGAPADDTLDRLSILARPRGVDAPAAPSGDDPDYVAPDVRRLHAGLLPLLARLAEHFPGRAIEIVSGYRPNAREGSRHRFGRAIDLRVEGIAIDDIRAFFDDEPCTGVGLYPTSGFVHLDVRTERVRWVDDSGPGQAPHVVRTEVGSHVRDTAPEPAPEPDPDVAAVDSEAIARAMHAADAITLDLALPP